MLLLINTNHEYSSCIPIVTDEIDVKKRRIFSARIHNCRKEIGIETRVPMDDEKILIFYRNSANE